MNLKYLRKLNIQFEFLHWDRVQSYNKQSLKLLLIWVYFLLSKQDLKKLISLNYWKVPKNDKYKWNNFLKLKIYKSLKIDELVLHLF